MRKQPYSNALPHLDRQLANCTKTGAALLLVAKHFRRHTGTQTHESSRHTPLTQAWEIAQKEGRTARAGANLLHFSHSMQAGPA